MAVPVKAGERPSTRNACRTSAAKVSILWDTNRRAGEFQKQRSVGVYCGTMRIFAAPAVIFCVALAACSSAPKPPAAPEQKAEAPKPSDESRRFPTAGLVDTKVVEPHLMGKPFMPGGTVAHYKKGKTEYDMFVAQFPTANDAAIALLDWSKTLSGSKLVASFGGYFGDDQGRPVFVFSKGSWIAGSAGLNEKEADRQARLLAAALD